MLPDTSHIKKAAKAVFKENSIGSLTVSFALMTSIFLGLLIAYLISYFAGDLFLLVFMIFYVYLFVFPTSLGAIRYFAALIEDEKIKPVEIFYYFSSKRRYRRAMTFVSSIFFMFVLSIFIAMIIPGILFVFSSASTYSLLNIAMPIWIPILKTVSVFLQILGIALVILINIKYYLSIYFFTSNDTLSPKDALKLSINISRRTKVDFWLLLFSLTGYIVLSVTVLPLFFILPYFILSYVVHSKCVAVSFNESVNFAKKQFTVVAK